MEGQNTCKNVAKTVVVMVPFPAQGHLNQLLHLSQLLTSYNIPVHYATSAIHNQQAKLRLQGRDSQSLTNIHFHDLEFPLLSSPPPNPNSSSSTHFPSHLHPVFDASLHLRQPLCDLLHQLAPNFKRVVVIHDVLMSSVVQDVKYISNAEAYIFNPVSAFFAFPFFWGCLPENERPFELDSVLPTNIMPTTEGCLTPEVAEYAAYQTKFMDFQSGILNNTCRIIEDKHVRLLKTIFPYSEEQLFAIGPFNPLEVESKNDNKPRHACLKWLDKQQPKSVIYISFGSTTTMTKEQIKELANGLEKSSQKFIWVLRNADICDTSKVNGVGEQPQLPKGFEDRIKDRGIIVKDWAPQLEILSHPSTGGFMSHCGWNSCWESISMGVPIAAWPMHSDQPMNAVLLTKVLGMGTMVREWVGRPELVMASEIEKNVTKLMASKEGMTMRDKAEKVGDAVREAVAKGGVSDKEMEAFISCITR